MGDVQSGGVELLAVGHGTLGQAELGELLSRAGVELVVDVRRAPGSRRHPHVARAELERWLPACGIAYRWEPRLGGWRRAALDSPNTALRNAAFRGYADHMASAEFADALDGLIEEAATRRTAAMCSESLWWRCHRRLLADAALLGRRFEVRHLGHDGRLSPHEPTAGVRLAEGGLLVYDAAPGGAARLWSDRR